MPVKQPQWFTETCEQGHCAFSLEIEAHCHHEKTPYQTIDIYQTKGFGYLMTIDGCTMVSSLDNFIYHEMMSHVPLLTHPNPKDVAIIGGGDCGTLTECLSHDIERITQIEIDKRVTDLSEQYFPELCQRNDDKRVHLIFEDAVEWIKQAETASLDVIIVDSTDPIGPGEGLFNQAFYEACHRVLKDDGLIVQQSESPLIHKKIIQSMRSKMKQAGFNDLLTYTFPMPIYPTGFWSATMAHKQQIPKAIQTKKLNTQYYCQSIHQACFEEIPMFKQL